MGVKNLPIISTTYKKVGKTKCNIFFPMHANTFQLGEHKTRAVDDIKKELTHTGFFDV